MRCSFLAALCARLGWAVRPAVFSFVGLLIAILFSLSTCIRTCLLRPSAWGLCCCRCCASAFFRQSSSSVLVLRRRQDRALELLGFPKPHANAFVPM